MTFVSKGVEGLLSFLSEANEDGSRSVSCAGENTKLWNSRHKAMGGGGEAREDGKRDEVFIAKQGDRASSFGNRPMCAFSKATLDQARITILLPRSLGLGKCLTVKARRLR